MFGWFYVYVIAIFVVTASKRNSSHKQTIRPFSMKPYLSVLPVESSETKRLMRFHELISTYIHTYRSEAIAKWPKQTICSVNTKFIVSHFICRDAGNNLGTWLDNLAWAIVTNQPIVAHWLGKASFCYGAVLPQPWILTTTKLAALQRKHDCYTPIVDVRLHGGHSAIGCCDVEHLNYTYFNPGRVYKLAYQKLRPQLFVINLFSEEARERSRVLFSNPCQLASYEAYGLLALHSIHFTAVVTNLTSSLLPGDIPFFLLTDICPLKPRSIICIYQQSHPTPLLPRHSKKIVLLSREELGPRRNKRWSLVCR